MEDSRDLGLHLNKRKKIEAAATEVTQQRKTADAAPADIGGDSSASPDAPISTPPAPPSRLRFPPYPKSGKSKDLLQWNKECRRIGKILEKDPRNNLPTQREPKDPDTTDAVQSSRDKAVVRAVARSVVSISSTGHDGVNIQCSGIIINQWEEEENMRAVIVTCSDIVCQMGRLLDPVPKISVGLPNKSILDGQLMFFNDHYGIALVGIDGDFPLKCPSIGSGPNYGQEIFVLARDEGSSLMARQGEILWMAVEEQ